MEAQEQEKPQAVTDAVLMAILRESLNEAADRVIAQREASKRPKPKRLVVTAGHLYFLMACITVFALVVAGAVSK